MSMITTSLESGSESGLPTPLKDRNPMELSSKFVCDSHAGFHYTCIASHFRDPGTNLPSLLVTVTDRETRIGSVQFVLSMQFQATFTGYWSDLIFAAQKRFVEEAWIEQILTHPGQNLQNPFEDFRGCD